MPAAPKPVQRSLRTLFRNFGWMAAARGGAGLFSLVYLAIITRSLGPEGFGRFTLILSASQAINAFVTFSTWQIVIHYGVAMQERGDRAGLGRLVRVCVKLDVASALVGAGLAVVLLGFLGHLLALPQALRREAIAFSLVQLLSIRSTPMGILRLHDRFATAAAADGVVPLIRLAGAALAALFLPRIGIYLLAWAAAEIATAIVYWLLAWKTGELREAMRARIGFGEARRVYAGFWRFCVASNAGPTLLLAGKQVAVLLVGVIAGPVAAGAFRVAHQLALAIAKVGQLVARATFPELVRAGAGGGAALRAKIRTVTLISCVSAAVVLAVLALIGRPLLGIAAGHGYESAYPILMLLGAAACVDLAAVTLEPSLMAMGRAGTAFVARLAATIVSLALQVVMLLRLGAIGGGVGILGGSLASAALLALAMWWAGRRERAAVPGIPPGVR